MKPGFSSFGVSSISSSVVVSLSGVSSTSSDLAIASMASDAFLDAPLGLFLAAGDSAGAFFGVPLLLRRLRLDLGLSSMAASSSGSASASASGFSSSSSAAFL